MRGAEAGPPDDFTGAAVKSDSGGPRRQRGWGRRALAALAVIAAAILLVPPARRALRPPPAPTAEQRAQASRVRILRDNYGVPHVFAQTDGDAAFGLAYAHAEDDWPTIQGVLAASRGKLGLLQPSKTALSNDYYAQLIDVAGQVETQYPKLPADLRKVLEGYAAGLDLYAALHPREADARLLPLTGRDIAAGFAHKLPLMFDLPGLLKVLEGKRAGDLFSPAHDLAEGSNAHAVLARRSADGITRLNVNSHQPWDGPVAWYEGQVHSEEGWNMTGSFFPGAPVLLHGHNEVLGWAHTVNKPPLVDVYALEMNPQDRINIDLTENGCRLPRPARTCRSTWGSSPSRCTSRSIAACMGRSSKPGGATMRFAMPPSTGRSPRSCSGIAWTRRAPCPNGRKPCVCKAFQCSIPSMPIATISSMSTMR